MNINRNLASMNELEYSQRGSLHTDKKKGISFDNPSIEKEIDLEEKHRMDFIALCEIFPDISFVVVDITGEPQLEYGGICDTSAFSDLDKISIKIEKSVIENWDTDYENIVTMIQWISDDYEGIKHHALASGAMYTAVTLHYTDLDNYLGIGGLSIWQTLWFDPPEMIRESGLTGVTDFDTDIQEKYIFAFLKNVQREIQNEAIDKLFDLGDTKRSHTATRGQKGITKYQKHFAYEDNPFAYRNPAAQKEKIPFYSLEEMGKDVC